MIRKKIYAKDSAIGIVGDDAKITIAEDQFGLKRIVDAIATNLDQHVAASGYTLGIEGRWGSGKTSFINFLAESLTNNHPAHEVIRFEPWLIGDRNALLLAYFAELAARIDHLIKARYRIWHINRWRRPQRRIVRLAKKVRIYGTYVGALAEPMAGAAAMDPSGTTASIAVGLKTIGLFSSVFGLSSTPIDALKSEITRELSALPKIIPNIHFTVLIDDLDRLEPLEAMEVLRLVTKVADFPNIRYTICFDKNILAKQVNNALNIRDGILFIEKIFQNVISIPPQEPFAIRRYFRNLLEQSFPNEMAISSEKELETSIRIYSLFDDWAGRLLTTPRDAVRVQEAVRFGWPHVVPDIDFYDFVWLQLIRLRSPKLYDWVQQYISNVGAYRDGGRAGDDEPKREATKLASILKSYGWNPPFFRSGLEYFLPGVRNFLFQHEEKNVFDFGDGELAQFERGKRLGSPSHWRHFFAFDKPSYAISDEEIIEFRLKAKEEPNVLPMVLRNFASRPHRTSGHFLVVLLDRLSSEPSESFSPDEVRGITTAFAEVMDEFATRMGRGDSGRREIWELSYKLLSADAGKIFTALASTSPSINWLAYIVRRQGFVHQKQSGSIANPREQWMTSETLRDSVDKIINRIQYLDPRELFEKPEPLDMLYLWLEYGDSEELRKFLKDITRDTHVFIAALNGMRTWANSSDRGVYYPLHVHNLKHFLDPDATYTRLSNLASSNTADLSARTAAQEILDVWETRP